MAVRTDEHREGVLVPTNYGFVEVLDLYAGTSKDDVVALTSVAKVHSRWAWFASQQREKVAFYQPRMVGERSNISQCNICGAHIRYAVIWKYALHGEAVGYISTGSDCAESVNAALASEIAEKAGALREFVAGMRRSARDAEAKAQAATQAEARQRWSVVDCKRQAWIAKRDVHGRVARFLHAVSTDHAKHGCSEECFYCDVTAQLVETGSLSGRQVDVVMRSVYRWEMRGQLPAPKIPIPSGTSIVTGSVISTRHYDSRSEKMLIQCRGYRVWAEVPAELVGRLIRGMSVRFVAELSVSERDNTFVIGSGSRDVEVVES